MIDKFLPHRPRTKIALLGVFAGVLLYLLGGFFILPIAITRLGPGIASGIISGSAEIGSVSINPLTFRVSISDFVLRDPDRGFVAGFDHFQAKLELWESMGGTITVGEILLEGPKADIVIAGDGSINLLKAVAPSDPGEDLAKEASEPVALPALWIELLQVANGEIQFTDHSVAEKNGGQPFSLRIAPVSFNLEQFSTDSKIENPFKLVLGDEGTFLHTEGTIQFDPLSVDGKIEGGLDRVKELQAYIDTWVNFSLGGGACTFSGAYHFEPLNEPRKLGLSEGNLTLRDFTILGKDPGGTSNRFFELGIFDVSGVDLDLIAQSARIDAINLADTKLNAVRREDASFDILDYLLPSLSGEDADPSNAGEGHEKKEAREPLRIGVLAGDQDMGEALQAALDIVSHLDPEAIIATLEKFDLSGASLKVEDLSFGKPMEIGFADASLSVQNMTNVPGETLTIEASTRISDHDPDTRDARAVLSATGELLPIPSAEMQIELKDFELESFSPILESFVPVKLNSLTVGLTGNLAASLPPKVLESGQLPPVKATLNTTIAEFELQALDADEPLVSYDLLSIENLVASTQALEVNIETIRIVNPYALAERLEDGELAVMKLMPKSDEAPLTSAEGAETSETPVLPDVRIGKMSVEGGSLRVKDGAVSPRSEFTVADIEVSLQEFDLYAGSPTKLAYSATIADKGKVRVDSSLIPLEPFKNTEILASIDSLPLDVFSSYSIEAIGRPIREGSLTGSFPIKVVNEELELLNEFNIKKLRFAGQVQGKPSIDLPITTAIALLEDSKGVIRRKIPIGGNVNSPEFNIQQLIVREINAVVLNTVTSPFKLLGSITSGDGVDTSDSDLDLVRFPPGLATLTPEAEAKLERIAAGLKERPLLGLVMQACVDPEADAADLRQQMLQTELDSEQFSSVEDPLRLLYQQYFPDYIVAPEQDTLPTTETVDATSPTGSGETVELEAPGSEARSPSFWRRLGSLFSRDTEPEPVVDDPKEEAIDPNDSSTAIASGPADSIEGASIEIKEASEPDKESESAASAKVGTEGAGLQPTDPLTREQMRTQLLEKMALPEDALVALAERRSIATLDFLIEQGVEPSRISVRSAEPPKELGAVVQFEIDVELN